MNNVTIKGTYNPEISPAELLRDLIQDCGLLTIMKKEFGFAFSMDISEKENGGLRIQFRHADSGNDIMSLDDLSAMLQKERKLLKDMTEARAQATDAHPIPFFKVGRSVRFVRSRIIEWLEQLQADSAQALQVPPLPKGKQKKHKPQ